MHKLQDTRKRGGRPTTYTPGVAMQLREYLGRASFPSIREFCRVYGYDPKQIRRWELKHSSLTVAIGTLRLKQDLAYGRAA